MEVAIKAESEIASTPPPVIEEAGEAETSGEDAIQSTGRNSGGWVRRASRRVSSAVGWCFGFGSIVLGLALLSVIPVLNFLSLGYLLEVSGRVAREGSFRSGFIGVRKASVIGSMVLGIWMVLWPVRFAAGMWRDAVLIAPGSPAATGWKAGLIVIGVLAVIHIVWACLRGGRLRHFLWPAPFRFLGWLTRPHAFREVGERIAAWVKDLRLPHYFWLGIRGFGGAAAWLFVPVSILILASFLPPGGGVLLSLAGGFLLFLAVLYLPFLQARFAAEQRFGALFELRVVRDLFRRAPIAFLAAFLVTLLFALPLYLLKIELAPRDVAWLPSLLFVVFMLPARMLTGWAVGRAVRREMPRFFVSRWFSRLAVIPIAGFYVFAVYLTQYLSWNGVWSLLEQHAFLVPAPLMAL